MLTLADCKCISVTCNDSVDNTCVMSCIDARMLDIIGILITLMA